MDPEQLKQLKQRHKDLLDECKALEEKVKAEKRDFTEEEGQLFDAHLEEIDKTVAQIKAANAANQRSGRLKAAIDRAYTPEPPTPTPNVQPTTEPVLDVRERMPATIRPYRPLVCFRGDDGPRRAYRMGQWSLAALVGRSDAQRWCRDHGVTLGMDVETRALSTGVNTAGGYLIPEEFKPDIIELLETYGVARRELDPEPMVRDTKIIPRRTGGLTSYFVGENTAPTESEPTWDQVQLTAKILATLTKMSIEVSEDTIVNLGEKIGVEAARAFALKEDQCAFLGDGTSTYGGMFGVFPKIDDGTHTASISEAVAGNTAFSTLDFGDFEAALGKLPEYAVQAGNAKWYISRVGFYASMARLMDAAGGNTMDHHARGPGLQFLGLPVVISQVCNSTTAAQVSTVVCVVGDMRMAASFGDRRQLTMLTSEHRYMELGQIGIRVTERFDIVIHDLGDTTNAGPVVGLKTPAA
jgi:HK97 family phage major capsid protein